MRKLILLFTLCIISCQIFAQTTKDLEILINDYQFKDTVYVGDTVMVQYRIVNHGPESLTVADTIYIRKSFSPTVSVNFF